ncbi:hypothetical protein L1049_015996 [Liquidambar formosana]|uniref:Uncharacterized protein n=1 Tax=Liquidambar formosana TaxID=63359 RepID=A0AAP0X6Y5_LIQFO
MFVRLNHCDSLGLRKRPTQSSPVKDYVHASKFDQYHIPSQETEHFVTLTLPHEFIAPWQQEGFTHLHFGAIRLALTFHGRKGLPAVSRIALLDSRFTEYQHAVIGTVQTTLNASTVFITLSPNFNMPLKDHHLCDALKTAHSNQLTKLFPTSWVTKYESMHQAAKPTLATDPLFIRKENGSVEIRFTESSTSEEAPVFLTQKEPQDNF